MRRQLVLDVRVIKRIGQHERYAHAAIKREVAEAICRHFDQKQRSVHVELKSIKIDPTFGQS